MIRCRRPAHAVPIRTIPGPDTGLKMSRGIWNKDVSMSDKAAPPLTEERIAYLEGLVRQARTAAAVFSQYTQEDVDRIVKPMVVAGLEQAQYLARLAIEETKLGVMEDKAIKNM